MPHQKVSWSSIAKALKRRRQINYRLSLGVLVTLFFFLGVVILVQLSRHGLIDWLD